MNEEQSPAPRRRKRLWLLAAGVVAIGAVLYTVFAVRWTAASPVAMRPEPAEVWLSDGRPARFGWRGRLYSVLSVVERPPREPEPGQPRCWRVTASPGQGIPAGGFRLCQDADTGNWHLTRDTG